LLSLTPLPPLPGFWSWFWVLGTAFVPGTPINEQAAAVPNPAVLACALVAIAVVLAATMRVIQVLSVMYWHEPLARLTLATESWIFAVSVVGALLLLTCGLSPTVVIKLIDLVG
jgi:NADH:ubiquinone oxidoreductase subunit 2 (subunit N)